ncbi:MAG: glycosyltransferase family 4 protein [Myxococcales bacterium]|nr:glycosyltransferase family 4 protein [Myxococcales bacterium]
MSHERIVVVTTSFPAHAGDPSGHFVAAEVRRLVERGARVHVIAPGRERTIDGQLVIGIADGGAFGWPGALARLRERPARAIGVLGFVLGARRALAALPHDRVIAHFILPGAWPIGIGSSRPLEVVAHGSDVRLLGRLPRRLRARILSALLGRGAHFRAVSHELASLLRSFDPRVAKHLVVEPAAIDLSRVPERAEARRRLGLDDAPRWVVIAGRLIPDKRVAVAVSAAELIPDARVVVLGDGPELEGLRRSFPGVRFLGLVPRDLALTWIAAADVLLSASRAEGAPSVLREARALGVPVVATAVGDIARFAAEDADIWPVDPSS